MGGAMIWVAFTAMALTALALVTLPLLRPKPAPAVGRGDYDLVVYSDQLGEVARDVERGLLTAAQAEAARIEIQRRMLAAGAGGKEAGGKAGEGGKKVRAAARPQPATRLAAGLAVLVPATAFGIYLALGAPRLPDRPFAERAGEFAETQEQAAKIQAMVAGLEAKLQQNPSDGKGWAMLGRSRRVLGETDKAHEAFRKAMELMPKDVDTRLEYAGLLMDEAGQLTREFVVVMREVLDLDPNQPDALYFVGMAEAQIGKPDKARTLWARLLALLPTDSPERAELQKLLKELG